SGADTHFRAVVSRRDLLNTCEVKTNFRIIMSLSGGLSASTTADAIRNHDVEIIGFQPTSPDGSEGIFNYYSLENLDGRGKKWRYFGSSQDFVANQNAGDILLNPKDPSSAVPKGQFDGTGNGAFPQQVRRCAGCHVNGGLVQKEMIEFWPHWD